MEFADDENLGITYGIPLNENDDHGSYHYPVASTALGITYGIPLNDNDDNSSYPYASTACATYTFDDEDFCDIIMELAQDNTSDDFVFGPSAVALPVNESPATAIAVPEVCVSSFDIKKDEFAPLSQDVKSVDEFAESNPPSLKKSVGATFIQHNSLFLKKGDIRSEQKMKRFRAVERLKNKRLKKAQRMASLKMSGGKWITSVADKRGNKNAAARWERPAECAPSTLAPSTGAIAPPPPAALNSSARQKATAERKRDKGKFKRCSTKWISVTELLRSSEEEEEEEEEENVSGSGQFS
mmetsp:Transcript_23591/g.47617  ORF Transcript_23591/g.47617 Transcript_23591/m.47617 type:complete len:298 (+) Transcript_23591:65-958(+)|eukprot:CAMPEP_0181310030 /NCGR_PEP_ID=MMETSP1101-20121128/12353_1 /TAXON_ID=46948 /ORGANISM="Rhodomonas abbreviata, Strain Caron Lab Isolate" /LENGTH=297 /DNA_ID=CAMNT_0023416601 /DNA_START=51 /DNA_END=944 /DNA_ORIENTATION=-